MQDNWRAPQRDRKDQEDTEFADTQTEESGFCRQCWGYTWMHQHDCPVVSDRPPEPPGDG